MPNISRTKAIQTDAWVCRA